MLQSIMKYTGEYKNKVYQAILFLVSGIFINVIPYYFVYEIIMYLIGKSDISTLDVGYRIVGIAICSLLYALLYMKGLDLSHVCAYKTLENIRLSLQAKMEEQPLGEIQDIGTGSIKKMFTDDIDSIESLLAHSLPEGVANIIIPILIYIAMFFVDYKLALLSLLSLPLGFLAISFMNRAMTNRLGAFYGASQTMNNTIIEYVNGMEVVKVFNKDSESYDRFKGDVNNYRDLTLDWMKVCRPWVALYNAILPCVAMFTLPVGAFLVLKGYSTLADFILVLCMGFSIGVPLLRAIGFMPSIPLIKNKIDFLEKMMTAESLKQTTDLFTGEDYSIEFDDVCFAYQEKEVLSNISIKAKEGQMLALVGESGSGKSTTAKLLVHYYDVNKGVIRIGNQDITKMSLEALNNLISYVSQDQFLFNISLLENIRLGNSAATDDEVIEAARKAQCMAFIHKLDKGIYSLAGDSGNKLSGGERQRISLARAILKNAPIIILDEATAFMDPENEDKMNKAIAEVIKNKTVVVIAHKLHSIVNAAQICVVNEGSVISSGTHKELLEGCEEYKKLWRIAEKSNNWKISVQEGGNQ